MFRILASAAVILVGLAVPAVSASASTNSSRTPYADILPAPVTARAGGHSYTLNRATVIAVDPRASGVGDYLAGVLRQLTGRHVPVVPARAATGAGRMSA